MTRLVQSEMLEGGALQRIALDAGKGNIFSTALMDAVSAALAEHRDDAHLKMVLLTSAQPHFSFGASVEEHRREQAPAMLASFHRFIRALAAHPVPVAAHVRGQCLGGAFEVACACHLVFVEENAKLACPEVKLGVFPPVLAAIGPLRLGHARAERLLLTGASMASDEAVQSGFASRVSSEADVLSWYREYLAPLSAFALRQATRAARNASGLLRALGEVLDDAERQYVSELLPSHDGEEGIVAFLERRTPRWEDR
jgi:cyclohexa-1,5-dienecarbonyl-CoA hydratase